MGPGLFSPESVGTWVIFPRLLPFLLVYLPLKYDFLYLKQKKMELLEGEELALGGGRVGEAEVVAENVENDPGPALVEQDTEK